MTQQNVLMYVCVFFGVIKNDIPYSHSNSRPFNFRVSSLRENEREQVHAVRMREN